MYYGISVYQTSDFTLEGNLEYMKKAGGIGYNLVFTSLHLPEVDYGKTLDGFKEISKTARESGMELIADISPATMRIFGATCMDLKPFSEFGISFLRADYGFSPDELSIMTRNEYGINIQINASTIAKNLLDTLKESGADFGRISACHNFYPRPETGLSYRAFVEKTLLCKEYNMTVFAFIPSRKGRRGPIYEGLPTLEMHRDIDSEIAAKHLLYTGVIDGVIFGDAYASERELIQVVSIDPDVIELSIELHPGITQQERNIVFLPHHTNRLDAPDCLIRSEESRGYAGIGEKIKPNNTAERKAYSVTIDNEDYKRYSGELQIVLKDLPADKRVNVAGRIPEDEHILAHQIKPGKKFRFREGMKQ
ncbi:DUF871 domain-containing protein [Thermoanaerobacterium sp. DL9XJH110]|uniref:DUF871 domain-containing protein n=1 Tax=Thermoanaerobacterium sp. DL9XJH110 TaxID=3386643 RepID=UPI003BB72C46